MKDFNFKMYNQICDRLEMVLTLALLFLGPIYDIKHISVGVTFMLNGGEISLCVDNLHVLKTN